MNVVVLQHKVSGKVCSCGFLAPTPTHQCWPEVALDLTIPREVGVPCGDGVPQPAAAWLRALWAAQSPRGARASVLVPGASSLARLSPRLWGVCAPDPARKDTGARAGVAFGCKTYSEGTVSAKTHLNPEVYHHTAILCPIAKERS